MTKTLQVLCNEVTPTPLQSILKTCQSGYWRINEEEAETLTHIEIFDESTKTKVRGKIVEMTYEKKADNDYATGYVVTFEPLENRDGNVIRSYSTTRPKFNRIGIAVK